jgi:hypothetical protein
MGIDACIYFKTTNGEDPILRDQLPSECEIRKVGEHACDGATHEVYQLWRYYGPGYERGPWPRIAAALMALHASQNIESVWYFGDCDDGAQPFTPERVHEFSAHYMAEGDRPYRGERKPAG